MPSYPGLPPSFGAYGGGDGYGGGGGLSIADLIRNRGRIAAEGAQRSGELWAGAIGTLGQLASNKIQQFGEQRDQRSVQDAVRTARSSQAVDPNNPTGGYEQIISSVSPELQPKVRAALAASDAADAASRESRLKIEKAKADLQAATDAHGKVVRNQAGQYAYNALKIGETAADGGLTATAYAIKRLEDTGVQVPPEFKKHVQDGLEALQQAGGDPAQHKIIADTFRQTAGAYLQNVAAGMDPEQQKALVEADKAARTPPVSLSEGATLVDPMTGKVVAQGAPKPSNLQHVETAEGIRTFDPQTGKMGPVIGKNKPAASLLGGPSAAGDVKESVAGMKDGTLPPQLPGRASKEYTAIMAEAHRQGFDLTGAAMDFTATQKHLATANGAQQTRMVQAVDNAAHSLDVIDSLADQWKGGSFPVLNKANLALAKSGANGPEAQKLAVQLEAQIADVTSELGNVYMGGNSPTDHALGLASKNLSADWSKDTLKAMTNLARTNLKIRMNSITHSPVMGASENNMYAPKPPAQTGPVQIRGDADFAALPSGAEFIAPDGSHRRKP